MDDCEVTSCRTDILPHREARSACTSKLNRLLRIADTPSHPLPVSGWWQVALQVEHSHQLSLAHIIHRMHTEALVAILAKPGLH